MSDVWLRDYQILLTRSHVTEAHHSELPQRSDAPRGFERGRGPRWRRGARHGARRKAERTEYRRQRERRQWPVSEHGVGVFHGPEAYQIPRQSVKTQPAASACARSHLPAKVQPLKTVGPVTLRAVLDPT